MLSPSGYDAITAQFETSIEDMPRISTASTKPNYTSLKIFQEALDGNALTISCQSTQLGMLALSRSKEDYEKANNGRDNGLKTVLVLSGVTTEEEVRSRENEIVPDFYADSINDFFLE